VGILWILEGMKRYGVANDGRRRSGYDSFWESLRNGVKTSLSHVAGMINQDARLIWNMGGEWARP
jgi:hypothetical protein